MSMFGDYKAYKKFEPQYPQWRKQREDLNEKRLEYIKQNPEIRNNEDIQRGQILLRAIDIMDEYSQKRAEDTEVATEMAIAYGMEVSLIAGGLLGAFLGSTEPLQKLVSKFMKSSAPKKQVKLISASVFAGVGSVLATLSAFPLMAWGAKAEVSASRKGRFEAMRKDLKNPKGFAVLTEKQIEEANKKTQTIQLEDDKKSKFNIGFLDSLNSLKEMVAGSNEYRKQRSLFELEMAEDKKNINAPITEYEAEQAKRDQQLLTKLVEKIDIASQDYAENTELATQTATTTVFAAGGLFTLGFGKLLDKMNIKSAGKVKTITALSSFGAMLGMAIFSNQIQKQAARVGRWKVKQELMQNPDNLIYVSDDKANGIKDVQIKTKKKENIFVFLKNAWKNNKKYEKYKKNEGKAERKFFKAVEDLELSENQMQNAKRLQKNTFKTFNKIDENSQKYSESVEALGQSVAYPVLTIFSMIAAFLATPYLMKGAKTKEKQIENFTKFFCITMLGSIPSILVTGKITKEQKKASRIADMLAINELNDYREFRAK